MTHVVDVWDFFPAHVKSAKLHLGASGNHENTCDIWLLKRFTAAADRGTLLSPGGIIHEGHEDRSW